MPALCFYWPFHSVDDEGDRDELILVGSTYLERGLGDTHSAQSKNRSGKYLR